MIEILTAYSIPFSIVLRILSCVIIAVFLLPLQFKEINVKNGLGLLRIQLLVAGIILFLTNVFSLMFLILALETDQKPLNASLQVINAIAFLILAWIAQSIYHTQYTDEAKDYHAKIDALEKEGAKKKEFAKGTAQKLIDDAKVKADDLLKNPKS